MSMAEQLSCRNHIGEGHLWQLYRVMIATVEGASIYLASRDGESQLFEGVDRIQQAKQWPGSAERRLDC